MAKAGSSATGDFWSSVIAASSHTRIGRLEMRRWSKKRADLDGFERHLSLTSEEKQPVAVWRRIPAGDHRPPPVDAGVDQVVFDDNVQHKRPVQLPDFFDGKIPAIDDAAGGVPGWAALIRDSVLDPLPRWIEAQLATALVGALAAEAEPKGSGPGLRHHCAR